MAQFIIPPAAVLGQPGHIAAHNDIISTLEFLTLGASGDSTGATDTATIQAALNGNQYVRLGPGIWYQNAPITMTTNSQTFIGSGANATSIQYTGATVAAAQIEVGTTSVIQNVTVGNFQTFGNANSGHSIQWRAKSSTLQNVTLQLPQSDCLHADPATISASINQNVFFNILGIHPGANGYFQSNGVNDSSYYSMTFDGGASGDTVPGGNIGINITGGANCWFFNCHPYLFAAGGTFVGSNDQMFFGGEFESNAVADLILNNAHHCVFNGVAFYDHANSSPPNQHILLTGTASNHIDIGQCDWREDVNNVPNFIVNSSSSTTVNVHDCPGYNPVGLVTPPTYTAGSPSTNTFMSEARVFVAGSTAVAINGTATGLQTGTFHLGTSETITPTGGAGSWTWFVL